MLFTIVALLLVGLCLKVRYRCSDVEVWSSVTWRYGDTKLRRRAADLETWRYGALKVRCKRADVEIIEALRYGFLEARCRCSDVKTELRRRAAGVSTWRDGGGGAM